MSEEATVQVRYRINVSTSVKGVKTFDCTFEYIGPPNVQDMRYALERSDALVAALDARYPPPAE